MKKISTLFLLLFTVLTIQAQVSPQPFKKANTITISTSLAPEEAFKQWGRHLGQNGFTIDKSDPNFLTITTGKKATSKMNFSFIVNSAVLDNGDLQVKIKWLLNSSILAGTRETSLYDWEYATSRTNVQNVIYNDLMGVIKSLGEYPVTYSIK